MTVQTSWRVVRHRARIAIGVLMLAVGALWLAGCDGDLLPDKEEVIDRLIEANASPRDMHSTAVMTFTVQGDLMGMGASMDVQAIVNVESWTDEQGRSRQEISTALGPETDAMLSGMMGQYGSFDMTMVTDGETMWSYMDSFGMYSEVDVSELEAQVAEEDIPSSPNEIREMYRQAIDYVVANFDVSVDGLTSVADRRAVALTAVPRPDAERPPDNPLPEDLEIGDVQMAVDLRTFTPLRFDVDARFVSDADPLGTGSTDDSTLSMRIQMNTTMIDFDPDFPEDVFVFTPPEDATRMDLSDGMMMPGLGGGVAPPRD